MAVVDRFQALKRERRLVVQRTHVVGHYGVARNDDGLKFLQIDTFGSEDRKQPGKQSQTLQLTEASARELWTILGREFGFSS